MTLEAHFLSLIFPIGLVSYNSCSGDGSHSSMVNEVKPEPVQSNGPSHLPLDPPPPALDNDSNGCDHHLADAPSHDRNGTLEPHGDAPPPYDRPAKRCRTEAEPSGQSEPEPSRTQQEGWWLNQMSKGMETKPQNQRTKPSWATSNGGRASAWL